MRTAIAPARWLRHIVRSPEAMLRGRVPLVHHPQTVATLPQLRHRRHITTEAIPPAEAPMEAPTEAPTEEAAASDPPAPPNPLPLQCTGCGAFSQTSDPNLAGFFDLHRKAVANWITNHQGSLRKADVSSEDQVVRDALKGMTPEEVKRLGLGPGLIGEERVTREAALQKPPLCDRCHGIVHHHRGVSIYHPTMDSIQQTIAESPHKQNHIYHVVDAADFPMSLIPRLSEAIEGVALRSRNRRYRSERFYHGYKIEMSFIITRSDLLAPTKEQVDRLMPYMQETLREALGRLGRYIRLGNVHLVSAKRSWWTADLKQKIWERGGAAWLVGKLNVGKSQLFEAIYPKGLVGPSAPKEEIGIDVFKREGLKNAWTEAEAEAEAVEGRQEHDEEGEMFDESALLPPARPLENYPSMPTVSAIPGTTASPIRIPFGTHKGELIDLPGLARSDLELYVKEEHRASLVLKSRVVPKQETIRPGQSLLLGGGLVRITPVTPDLVFLAYSFTPIEPHVTSTRKAAGLQDHSVSLEVGRIATEEAAQAIRSAGKFELKTDLTKSRSGPITRNDFLARKVAELPWRVLGIDILVDGVGWVEVVAQVRTKDLFGTPWSGKMSGAKQGLDDSFAALDSWPRSKEVDSFDSEEAVVGEAPVGDWWEDAAEASAATKQRDDPWARFVEVRDEKARKPLETGAAEGTMPNWPVIEVFTPEGRFVASRRCMNGWLLNKPLVLAKHKRSRPRKSMKGQKKLAKRRVREMCAAHASGQ